MSTCLACAYNILEDLKTNVISSLKSKPVAQGKYSDLSHSQKLYSNYPTYFLIIPLFFPFSYYPFFLYYFPLNLKSADSTFSSFFNIIKTACGPYFLLFLYF